MVLKLFGKKKTIDRVSIGELKMMKSELDFKITSIRTEINSVSEKNFFALQSGKNAETEDELKFAAREITNLIAVKKELLGELETAQKKRLAVERIIRIKEDEVTLFEKKNSIFDKIDIESLTLNREEKEIRNEIENMKLDKILNESEPDENYQKVLEILKSVNLDGESIDIAKTEVDSLASGQIL